MECLRVSALLSSSSMSQIALVIGRTAQNAPHPTKPDIIIAQSPHLVELETLRVTCNESVKNSILYRNIHILAYVYNIVRMFVLYICLLHTGKCTCTLCVACIYVYFQAGASSKKNNDTKTHWRWQILRDKRLTPLPLIGMTAGQLEQRALNAETSNLHHSNKNLQPMRTNKTKEWRYYITTIMNSKKVKYFM